MIPQPFIQDLLARADIVDVIESYVPLKRAGSNLSARCPFHSEKTPSFTVSPTKQFYHCFGCGAHGSAITFLMEFHGMSFVEAVKDLAARVGMSVPENSTPRRPDPGEATEDLIAVLTRAAHFYKVQLKQSPRAVAYLKSRGLTGEIAARYGLGYAPDSWQGLDAEFGDYRGNQALLTAGLVVDGAEGRRYDRFRDRIMFPIHSQRGAIIGFGGRVIDAGEPKYLNSPETPVFEKGREVYGLLQARQAIREAGMVVVVEGYMDVVALAQYGLGYAVATLGTATTLWQVHKLLRQTDRVVFAFDGDDAGRRAAWRALENSLSQLVDGKQVAFLFLPDGEDPDSFVRKQGKEALAALLPSALPLSEFMLQELARRADLRSAEGRAKFLQDAKPLVKQVGAPMFSLLLRKRIAELSGLTPSELDARYEIKLDHRPQTSERRAAPSPSVLRTLAELLLVRPALARLADPARLTEFGDLAASVFSNSEYELFVALLALGRDSPNLNAVSERFRGTPLEALVHQVEVASLAWQERMLDDQALEADFSGAWRLVIERLRKAQIGALLEKTRQGGWTAEEKELYRRLQQRPASGGTVIE
ncbi:MAG: DNA primase [Burkholderiales bacterium]